MNPDYISTNPQQVTAIAIAVSRTGHGNMHAGVAYRHSDGTVHLFHQAWHHDTRDGEVGVELGNIGGRFFAVIPLLDEERARAAAMQWEVIANLKEQLPYAFADDPYARFDDDTKLLVLPNGIGVSCSTFVLALIRTVRIPWMETKDWPVGRTGDREWLEQLVKLLEKTCSDKSHVQQVRQEVQNGCARIRPEEVTAAGLYDERPACFHMTIPGGQFLVDCFDGRAMARRPLPIVQV